MKPSLIASSVWFLNDRLQQPKPLPKWNYIRLTSTNLKNYCYCSAARHQDASFHRPSVHVASSEEKKRKTVSPPIFEGIPNASLQCVTVYVIGSGIAGVTAAYELATRGFHVIVFDSRSASGTQCTSASNGSLIREIKPFDGFSMLPALFKGSWYWSDFRHKFIRLPLIKQLRRLCLKVKRKTFQSHDSDPEFERLDWSPLVVDDPSKAQGSLERPKMENALSAERFKNQRLWMASRSPRYCVKFEKVITDPHFWRWSCKNLFINLGIKLGDTLLAFQLWIHQKRILLYTKLQSQSPIYTKRNDEVINAKTGKLDCMRPRVCGWHLHRSRRDSEMLKFMSWSIDRMKEIIIKEKINCEFRPQCGTLETATTTPALQLIKKKLLHHPMVVDAQVVDAQKSVDSLSYEPAVFAQRHECERLFPSLGESPLPLKGGLFRPLSGAINPTAFVKGLQRICEEKYGVQFAYEKKVLGFVQSKTHSGNSMIVGIHTDQGTVSVPPLNSSLSQDGEFDLVYSPVIIAAGAWSPRLTAELGVYTPIYPIKGASLIFDKIIENELRAVASEMSPEITPGLDPLLNDECPTVVDRVAWMNASGNSLRLSTFAILAGWSLKLDDNMKDALLERARILFPYLFDGGGRCAIAVGLRPVSNDGCVLIGSLPHIHNGYVCTGGGFHGLKVASGSAVVISEIVKNQILSVLPERESRESKKSQFETLHQLFDLELLSTKGRAFYSPIFCRMCLRRWRARHDKM